MTVPCGSSPPQPRPAGRPPYGRHEWPRGRRRAHRHPTRPAVTAPTRRHVRDPALRPQRVAPGIVDDVPMSGVVRQHHGQATCHGLHGREIRSRLVPGGEPRSHTGPATVRPGHSNQTDIEHAACREPPAMAHAGIHHAFTRRRRAVPWGLWTRSFALLSTGSATPSGAGPPGAGLETLEAARTMSCPDARPCRH